MCVCVYLKDNHAYCWQPVSMAKPVIRLINHKGTGGWQKYLRKRETWYLDQRNKHVFKGHDLIISGSNFQPDGSQILSCVPQRAERRYRVCDTSHYFLNLISDFRLEYTVRKLLGDKTENLWGSRVRRPWRNQIIQGTFLLWLMSLKVSVRELLKSGFMITF